MPKGIPKMVDPGQKIQDLIVRFNRTMDLIIDKAGNPEFAASITQLKKDKEALKVKEEHLSKDLLLMREYFLRYPGLAKQFVLTVRAKISEYTELGLIDKYKEKTKKEESRT
jgi:hypothetical protein